MNTEKKQKEPIYKKLQEKYSLADLHQGNERIFADIVQIYTPLLQYQIKQKMGIIDEGAVSSQDIAQETLTRLWINKEKIISFPLLGAYMCKIASNLCTDVHRQKKNRNTSSLEISSAALFSQQPSDSKKIEAKDTFAKIYDSFDNVASSTKRDVFLKVYSQNLSDDVIAEQLNIKETTVRAARHFIQKEVRRKFDYTE